MDISFDQFVLKFKGREEYLLEPDKYLWNIDTLRKLSRKRARIELLLSNRKDFASQWEKRTDFYDRTKYIVVKKEHGTDDTLNVVDDFLPFHALLLSSVDKTFKLKISKVENFEFLLEDSKPKISVVVVAEMYGIFFFDGFFVDISMMS